MKTASLGRRPSPSIADLSSAVVDNGRRGEPKLGCDCVQCFGYCLVDNDLAFRLQIEMRRRSRPSHHDTAPIDAVIA